MKINRHLDNIPPPPGYLCASCADARGWKLRHPETTWFVGVCDVRRLCEGLGGRVTWTANGAHLFAADGHEIVLATGKLETDYWRCGVRELAEALGCKVAGFTALNAGTAARVDLTR